MQKKLKPKPPHFIRNSPFLLIRNDRYTISEQEIYLLDFKLKFNGKWIGKQGQLEIRYDSVRKKWYATIPMEVVPMAKPIGDKKAGIDLVNLASVAVEDGKWMLFKGGSVMAKYKRISRAISKEKKKLAMHKQKTSRKLESLYRKRKLLLKNAREGMARELVEKLYDNGVSKINVGYPKGIAQSKGNERNSNFWNYDAIINRLIDVGEEFGITVKRVD